VLQDILDEAVDLHLGILGLREIQSSKFMRVFKGLLTSNWALGFPKYTTGFQSHALVFIIFSGSATLEWPIQAHRGSNRTQAFFVEHYCNHLDGIGGFNPSS
jgi:hypothetical protein